MHLVLITQVRMNSTRLPGKILRPVMGRPLLYYHLERLKMVRQADEIIVATVDSPECEPIAQIARESGVSVYRGSEEDVLDRYYQAARMAGADAVIRVTSDCPLIDPTLIDALIEAWDIFNRDCYISINIEGFARGFDAELFPFHYLEKAWHVAREQADREHVTRFMYRHPKEFAIKHLDNDDEHIGHYRFCVDTAKDFELIEHLLETLWPDNSGFSWVNVINTMKENPDWFKINAQVEQKTI